MNNGHMQESSTRVATLEDVDVDTFVGFYEFACTGDYTAPAEPSEEGYGFMDGILGLTGGDSEGDCGKGIVSPSPQRQPIETDAPMESESDEWGHTCSKKGKKGKSSFSASYWDVPAGTPVLKDRDGLWQRFGNLRFDLPRQTRSVPAELIYHAKLYAFAEERLIEPLKTCCLGHLHRQLQVLVLDEKNIARVLHVLYFAYEHRTRQSFSGDDRLRKLISHYVACTAGQLQHHKWFRPLLDRYGEMGSDLIHHLLAEVPPEALTW